MSKNLYYNTIHDDDADPHVLQEQDLLNLLEYGSLADWRPLLHALRSDPTGPVAKKLETILGLSKPPASPNSSTSSSTSTGAIPLTRS